MCRCKYKYVKQLHVSMYLCFMHTYIYIYMCRYISIYVYICVFDGMHLEVLGFEFTCVCVRTGKPISTRVKRICQDIDRYILLPGDVSS